MKSEALYIPVIKKGKSNIEIGNLDILNHVVMS